MKYRVLLVEDDHFKRDRIKGCLESAPVDLEIVNVASVQAAVSAILQGKFDAILLDMALPSHDLSAGAGQSTSLLSGGMEIIMELSYLRRPDRVIVITQYPEVEMEGKLIPIKEVKNALATAFEANVAEVILYEHESDVWVPVLVKSLGFI